VTTGLPLVERRGLLEGRRSTDWRKLLNYHHDVFVVGG
jgi:hypothetical protein